MLFSICVGNVWAAEELAYTLTPAAGSNNGYANACDVTISNITWNVTGNAKLMPWRIGGKSLSGVDRTVYSKTPMSDAITKVELTVGAASNITVNSVKLIVASDASFSNKLDEVTKTSISANTKITFTPASLTEWDASAYYKFVFNVSVSGTSNKFVEFSKADFYREKDESAPVLTSLTIDGDLSNKSYEEGQELDFSGLTVTGTYSNSSTDNVTNDVEWSFTPALAVGTSTYTVTATIGEIFANKTINNVTVIEHVVTPGEYDITPNNAFWGTSYNGNPPSGSPTSFSASKYDITVQYNKGSGSYLYINDSQTRIYPKNTLAISVPTGYNITSIVFTGTFYNTMTPSVGEYTSSTKTWEGKANSVTFTGGGSSSNNQCSKITVTYEAISPEVTVDPASLSFTAKQNIAVEGKTFTLEGANLTSGLSLAASTGFSVSPTSLTAEAAMVEGGVEVTVTPATPTTTTTPVEGTVTISGGGLASNVVVNLSMAVTPTYLVGIAVNSNTMGLATINGGSAAVYVTADDEIALVATPAEHHEFVNWTVSDENIIFNNANAASTTALAGAAGTITANFQQQACQALAAPVLDEITKTYQSATIAWNAVDNASAGYEVYVYNDSEKTSTKASDIVTEGTSFAVSNLDANTTYYYTVMAIGDGTIYCDASNPVLESNFTTNDFPAATLSLVENGGTPYNFPGSHKLKDVVNLPTTLQGLGCTGKVLAGWSSVAVEETDTKPATNYWDAGAEYTLNAETQTLYAVLATQTGGGAGNVELNVGTYASANGWENSKAYTSFTIDGITFTAIGGGNNGKYYTSDKSWRFYNGGSLSISGTGITGVSSTPSVSFTNNNGTYSASFSATKQFTSIVVSVSSPATFEAYTTSCTAALPKLDAPTFGAANNSVFYESTDITISAATGASIYYTTDGTTPSSTNGTLYEGAITLNAYGTYNFKAIAVQAGHEDSEVAEATYAIGKEFASVSDLYSYLEANLLTSLNNVKVTGLVSRITTAWDAQKGYLTYYISDNGQTTNDLQMYHGAGEGASALAEGDQVTVAGNYTYFQSTTHEFAAGNTIVARTAGAHASYEIVGELTQTNFIEGATFEDSYMANLKVNDVYNTGYKVEVADVTFSANKTTLASSDEAVHITATKNEETLVEKDFAISVSSATLASFALKDGYKTEYYVGEAFVKPTVIATLTDNSQHEAEATSCTGYNMSVADNYEVTVSYTYGEITIDNVNYNITVKAIANEKATAYTAAEINDIIANAYKSTTASTYDVYVKGIVVADAYTTSGSSVYYISADGTTTDQFYIYGAKYFDSSTSATGNVKAGDDVIVKGKIQYYNSNTPELKSSNVVYQLRAGALTVADVAEFEVGTADLAEADLTINRKGSTGAITFSCEANDALEIVENGTKLRAKGEATADVTVTATMAADNTEGQINFTEASTTFTVHVVPAQVRYAVTFDLNGGSAEPMPSLGDQLENANVVIPAGTFTKSGYKFNGWTVMAGETPVEVSNNAGVYSFTMPAAAVTVTAQWAEGSEADWVAATWASDNNITGNTDLKDDYATIAVDANVSLTWSKATGSNVPAYNSSSKEARLYQNTTLQIAAEGKLIKKITFTFTQNYEGALSANVGTYSSNEWTGLANAITFTNTSSTQARIKSINIEYINGTITTLSIENVSLKLSEGTKNLSISCNVDPVPAISYEIATADQAIATVEDGVVTAKAVGGPINVTATIDKGSNYTAAVANFTITVTDKTQPTMSFPQASYNANLGSDFEEPALTTDPEGIAVTYSSSVETVATVDASTGVITLVGEGETVITASFEEDDDYSANSATYTLNVIDPYKDVLTAGAIEVTGSYANWSDKTFGSGIKYAGNSTTGTSGNAGAIQMRVSSGTQEKSGIVTTTAIGYLKSISATRKSGSNYLDVYAKGSAYESAADLYDNEKQGTLIGTINNGAMVFDGTKSYANNYKYIGIKSHSGAVYYDDITITWEPAEFESFNVTYQAGEVSADPVVESIEEGSIISLAANTFTAPEGKIFNGWKLEGEENIREAGSKYTVTEAVTFVAQWISVYTITYKAGEGTGDDVVVENVPVGNYQLAENTFTAPESKEFAGWKLNNEGDVLAANSDFEVTANAEFTAQWSIIKQQAGLAYTTTSYTIIRGREFTAPMLTNDHNVEVIYSGNNDAVATVDAATGAITLQGGIGIVTVTATFAGNDYYYAAEASYTLKVMDASLAGGWERLTASSALINGMKVIIAEHVSSGTAIKTMGAQNTNNRAEVAGVLDEGKLVSDEGTAIFTLVKVGESTYAFKTADNKYLYAASSGSNHLKSQAKIDGNATWTISLSADGKATITAQGENTRNLMRYNKINSVFSCYGSGQQDIALYSKTIAVSEGEMDASTLDEYADVVVADDATLVINAGTKPLGNISGNVEVNAPLQAEGVHLGVNNTMTVNSTVNVPSFSISVQLGGAGQATNVNVSGSGSIAAPEGYVDMALIDNGRGGAGQWHSFTVPFPVDALNGIYNAETGAKLVNETNYAIMDYHSDIRANGEYGWKKYRGILQPGTFYMITVDGSCPNLRFMKTDGSNYVAANNIALTYQSGTGASTDFGWCGVGNQNMFGGYVSFTVQILNSTGTAYDDVDPNAQSFSACIPFFIQVTQNETLVMSTTNPSAAPARVQTNEIKNQRIYFGNENYTDKLTVSASEDALNQYEIGKDLLKMTVSNTPTVPQIFGSAYGNKLCRVNAPMANDQAEVVLDLYAPEAGEYTISAEENANSMVYLVRDGHIIWNLSMGAYTADFVKGNNAGYSICIVKAPDSATGISNVQDDNVQCTKAIIDEHVYILRGEKMYDVNGKLVR